MGVPFFYTWLIKRCPSIVSNLTHDIHVDNLYLDMNQIIHHFKETSTHPLSEQKMIFSIFLYIEELVNLVQPKKYLYLAIDGVPPRAKSNQQRQRRWKPFQNVETQDMYFDETSITPGTSFMNQFDQQMQYFIRKKIQDDKKWQSIQVIFSGSDVPGEGEHKIMDFIRENQSQKNYDKNQIHVFYGLDSDLIMLGLSTHEKNFILLRESNTPNKAKLNLIHLSKLRDYIHESFDPKLLKVEYNLERIIDDFILMLFLCGNDFLPNLPTLDIGEGALNYFFGIYGELLKEFDDYITDCSIKDVKINFNRLEKFIQKIATFEESVLNKRLKKMKFYHKKLEELRQPIIQIQQPKEEEDLTMEYSTLNRNHLNLLPLIVQEDRIECLNSTKESNLLSLIHNEDGILESDSDEQLLIKISFMTKVKLSSIIIKSKNTENYPSKIKLCVNQTDLDFDDVEDKPIAQEITITKNDIKKFEKENNYEIPLKVTKFSNVTNLHIFIESNLTESDKSIINELKIFGFPNQDGILNLENLKKMRRRYPKRKYYKKPKKSTNQTSNTQNIKSTTSTESGLPQVYQESCKLSSNQKYLEIDIQLWKQLYYENAGIKDEQSKNEMIKKYLEGLLWNLKYYFMGCQSWTWNYNYHYAPCASDFKNLPKMEELSKFEIGKPLLPFENLLCVLPPSSRSLIPSLYHPIMLSTESPIIDLYPNEVKVCFGHKGKKWEKRYLLPFMDIDRLKKAMKNFIDESILTNEEKSRNSFGNIYIFEYDQSGETCYSYESTLKGLLPDIEKCNVKVKLLPFNQ